MRKHRLLIVVSALSLASLSTGTQAFAREGEPRDDHGDATAVASDDRRGVPQAEVGDQRHGADDPAGDDRGVDSQPHN